jgi:hypothetical protein
LEHHLPPVWGDHDTRKAKPTMTVHAPSDVRVIVIPTDRGGCGQPHEAGDLADGERFAVTCAACEPHIVALRTGWAVNPDSVHLTPDEIAAVEVAEKKAAAERNRSWGDPRLMASAFADAMRQAMGTPSPEATSLMAMVSALSPTERAALGAMLRDEGGADSGEDAPPRRPTRSRKADPAT